jgi:hypothetical protein
MSHSKAPWNHLRALLENLPSTADEVESVLQIIREQFPVLPTPKIVFPGGPWIVEKPRYVYKSHLTHEPENFNLALDNISKTGRTLDLSEHIFLHHLLEHPFGWSATTPAHHNDSWLHYLRHLYTLPDIVPIFDDMTWPEDIEILPYGYGIGTPQFVLLADSKTFYVFNLDGHALYQAGATIEEANWGFRNGGWLYSGPPPEHQWVEMADNGEEYDSWDYFPLWGGGVDKDGTNNWHLVDPLRPFVPLSKRND